MLDTSKIYRSNNYGDFKILSYKNAKNIEVEFVITGFKTIAQSSDIINGNIKDRLHSSVYGVGFIGDGRFSGRRDGKLTKMYNTWSNMLARCYYHKTQKSNPTYKRVTVCKEWHNFQNFAKWFDSNYIEGFHMDKDINQEGVLSKVYSPETCKFVSQEDNIIEASAKHYRIIDPNGIEHKVYNMAEFSRNNNLRANTMSEVYSGKRKSHKGWTKA